MALTIEDGSIVAGADSWITVAEFAAYSALLGRTLTASAADQEIQLRKAQRAISTRYELSGERVSADQRTCLPRYWGKTIRGFTVDSATVPQDFKDAQAELAWAIHEGADPFADVTATTATQGPVTGKKVKAGPVETTTNYADTSSAKAFDARSMSNYTSVKALLDPYFGAGESQTRIMRA